MVPSGRPRCRRAVCALLALLLTPPLAVSLTSATPRAQAPADDMAAALTEPLGIATKGGRRAFKVEVMRNDADRARGLMFRKTMAPDRGMLFDFEQVQPVSMWMKNTYLALDMVFIRADGTVARVAADTEPLSTRVVPSGEPVLAVLELNAGTAEKLGIRPGDRVEHALLKGRGAPIRIGGGARTGPVSPRGIVSRVRRGGGRRA